MRSLTRLGHSASAALCGSISIPLVIGAGLLAIAAWMTSAADAQLQIQIRQFDRRNGGEENAIAGVHLPTERAVSRAVVRAKDRLAAGEYHEALTFLQGVLTREEDTFLETGADEREQQGLKTTARRLIGELPTEGLDAYERLYGATARRQLEAALQSGSPSELAKVVRQYFHTSAGYEAALVLAQVEADLGHRLAAAGWYRELLTAPRAAARFEPQLSLLAALNYATVGQPEEGEATLRALFENRPGTEIMLAGKTVTAPDLSGDVAGWLSGLVGTPTELTQRELQWLTVRGVPARNVQVPGGRPHLRPRWQARVVNEPAVETYLEARAAELGQRGVVVVPAARPLAVGNVVVMRTPENVVAIDWQTGKRIWETRDDHEFDSEGVPSEFLESVDPEQSAAAGKPIEERMWEDVLTMSLASDGQRVFVIRGGTARPDDGMNGQIFPGFGGMPGEGTPITNQLVAFDLVTEGKLLWELDGGQAAAPLDGAFFLGAPLAIDDTLFVMAEVRRAIYLFALDPATGQVRWQQLLVELESGIDMDPLRRRSAASPSYDGGKLICPTGAGAVIAVDIVKREFAWVYRYPREVATIDARNIWQQAQPTQPVRINDRWLDGTAIIADGHVLLAPPESGELHCLDLQSGKQAWKQRKGNSLFVGGVHEGRVLLIGPDSVQALRMADGASAWDEESVALPLGGLPAGFGYTSDGRYYLPLTSGEIAAIELASGEIDGVLAPQENVALGNLIFHRGSIISQSTLVLDKFEQLDSLQQRAQSAVKANPEDATALVELAELKRAEGDLPAAVKLLKSAYESAPNNPLPREMLAEALLEAMAADFAAVREDLPLVTRLVQDRSQQIELARIEAAGLQTVGQRIESWDAYLRLADSTADEPARLQIDDNYNVRSDRWICGRLGVLWSEATAEERQAMAAKLATRRPAIENPRTAAELRHYLSHFDQLPGAGDVRQALVRFLIDRERYPEAELELLELRASAKEVSDSSVTEWTARMPARALSGSDIGEHAEWPRGHVDAELIRAAPVVPDRGRRVAGDPQSRERQTGLRQLRIEQDAALAPAGTQWLAALDCSELVGRNALGDEVFRLAFDQNNWPHQYRDSNAAHAARLGSLLYVAIGGQVVAIDARQTPHIGLTHSAVDSFPGLLWQSESASRLSSASLRGRRGYSQKPVTASRRPVYHAWSSRKRIMGAAGPMAATLGPVTPRGVVYQEQNELVCVEPLSGETLWMRTDVPAGCELFGDHEYLFAADAGARVAHVFRMSDGERLETRPLPQYEWLLTAGRNVAELGFRATRDGRALLLRITDLWSQEVLFKAEYSLSSRTAVIEPHSIAVYQPSGQLQVIDVRTGRTVIDQQLQSVPDVQAVYTMVDKDELFLFITAGGQQKQHAAIGQPDYPLVNGLVYALNLKTGEPLWPAPATVRYRGIVLSQAPGTPLLVFADQKMTRDPKTGGSSQLRILCLDKRTGQAVYRNEAAPATPATRFDVRGERDGTPGVVLDISGGKIQLTMTDRPRPPQPPANDDLEAPREIAERGLRGIGERLTGALRESLEKQPAPAPVPADDDPQPQLPQEEVDDD